MITATVEQRQGSPKGATTRRIRVSASSIKRALEICGAERPDTDVRIIFPIEAESFFAPVEIPVENTSCGYMLPVEVGHRNFQDNIAAEIIREKTIAVSAHKPGDPRKGERSASLLPDAKHTML